MRPGTAQASGTSWPRGGLVGEALEAVLHHISKGEPYRGRAIALKVRRKLPRILTVAETQAILDAGTRLRDRLFALLHESGCRACEALGLAMRTSLPESEISIVPRDNANGARAKSGGRTVLSDRS